MLKSSGRLEEQLASHLEKYWWEHFHIFAVFYRPARRFTFHEDPIISYQREDPTKDQQEDIPDTNEKIFGVPSSVRL